MPLWARCGLQPPRRTLDLRLVRRIRRLDIAASQRGEGLYRPAVLPPANGCPTSLIFYPEVQYTPRDYGDNPWPLPRPAKRRCALRDQMRLSLALTSKIPPLPGLSATSDSSRR